LAGSDSTELCLAGVLSQQRREKKRLEKQEQVVEPTKQVSAVHGCHGCTLMTAIIFSTYLLLSDHPKKPVQMSVCASVNIFHPILIKLGVSVDAH